MYGTIALIRVKMGMEGQFRQLIEGQARAFATGQVPGFVASYTYCSDADENDFYLAVVFASKEEYWANAQSSEQDARYRQWLPLLESEPKWHDGEIVAVYDLQKPG